MLHNRHTSPIAKAFFIAFSCYCMGMACAPKTENETNYIRASILQYNRGEKDVHVDSMLYNIELLTENQGYIIWENFEGKGKASVFKCNEENPDTIEVLQMDDLPTYLHLTEYCKPRYDTWNGKRDFAWHYTKETQRTYQINGSTYTVFSFSLDFIGSDAGHRLYFSPQLGPLAACATSWGNRVEYHLENQPQHTALLKEVMTDKDFFPRPVEAYPEPPAPAEEFIKAMSHN